MKPCNFCGFEEGWTIKSPLDFHKFIVQCNVCGAMGPESKTREGAEKKWDGYLKTIDPTSEYFDTAIEEDAMGGVGAPMATLNNTPGMGNATPASQAATTSSQQYSQSSKGSGDKWGNSIGTYTQNGKLKKKKTPKTKKTNEDFYPSLEESNINPYDKLGVAMAKKMKISLPFKKGKNQTVHQKNISK